MRKLLNQLIKAQECIGYQHMCSLFFISCKSNNRGVIYCTGQFVECDINFNLFQIKMIQFDIFKITALIIFCTTELFIIYYEGSYGVKDINKVIYYLSLAQEG